MTIDGEYTLVCGANHIGRGAVGWSGMPCDNCGRNKKRMTDEEKKLVASGLRDACKATVECLVYFPEIDTTAILDLGGGSFMAGVELAEQLATLGKRFAEKPEIQAAMPGTKRVNSYFFKTKIRAGAHTKGDNGYYQPLAFDKVVPPYDWNTLLADQKTVAKAVEIFNELTDYWKNTYCGHNSTALLARPSAESPVDFNRLGELVPTGYTLPAVANTPAALPGGVHKIVEPAKQSVSQSVTQSAVQPAAQPVTQSVSQPVELASVTLDDITEPLTAASVEAQELPEVW